MDSIKIRYPSPYLEQRPDMPVCYLTLSSHSMCESEIQPFVPLILRRRKVVLPLLPTHLAPNSLSLLVDENVEQFSSNK